MAKQASAAGHRKRQPNGSKRAARGRAPIASKPTKREINQAVAAAGRIMDRALRKPRILPGGSWFRMPWGGGLFIAMGSPEENARSIEIIRAEDRKRREREKAKKAAAAAKRKAK